MRTVKLHRNDFVEKVAANRAEHRAVFEAALGGYQRRLVRELEHRIADVRAGRQVDHYIRLPDVDPYRQLRVGIEGAAPLKRSEWGLTWNVALEAGGPVLSDRVDLELDLSAIKGG